MMTMYIDKTCALYCIQNNRGQCQSMVCNYLVIRYMSSLPAKYDWSDINLKSSYIVNNISDVRCE